jgi:hypothetical protein
MPRFPKFIVVFTDTQRHAPAVFYEIANQDSYQVLRQFISDHPDWDATHQWSRRRFQALHTERLKQGLASPHFRETRQGWIRVSAPQWPLAAAPKEQVLFVPQFS